MIKAMLQTWLGNKADQDTIKTLQDKRLKELVRYARAYSLFYQRLYAAIGDDFLHRKMKPSPAKKCPGNLLGLSGPNHFDNQGIYRTVNP